MSGRARIPTITPWRLCSSARLWRQILRPTPPPLRPICTRDSNGLEQGNSFFGIWGWTRTRSKVPPTPLVLLAQRLSKLADWATAAEVLRAALANRPDDYEIHRQLGWYLRQLGPDHFDEATAEFRRGWTEP